MKKKRRVTEEPRSLSGYLKHGFRGVSLHVISVDDDLNDSVPNFLAYIIPGNADQVQDGVYVPRVIHCVLFCQDCHLQNLAPCQDEEKKTELQIIYKYKINGKSRHVRQHY